MPTAVGSRGRRAALGRGAFEAALRPKQAGDAEKIPAMSDTERQSATAAPVGPSPPFFEEWWFWTIIGGVVVAGLAVGLGVGVADRGRARATNPSGQVVFTF